jgi:mannose/cellobiose epimerase-like protein (N-acyl-D-glucosamine 2-epimerase family)
VVIEKHEEAFMQIMILCKLGPAAPEVHLAMTVIVHLHFIWSSFSRFFVQDGFTELTPVHKLSKLERNMLLLMALSTSDNTEGEKINRRRRRSIARSSVCIHKLASNRRGTLRFVLTPQWTAGAPLHGHGRQPSHHGHIFRLVLTAARTATPMLLHHGADV